VSATAPRTRLVDPLAKRALRFAYRAALGAQAFATARARGGAPRVWYGGARTGDVGGTLVKLQRLAQRFPDAKRGYNLVYLLSNAPYLPALALARLKRVGVPIVLNQNGVFYAAWFDGDWQAMNARMADAYRAADHVFFQSAFCRRAAERFLGVREGAGEILHNAVDVERFAPGPKRVPAGPFTFLMTGKIDAHMRYRPLAALEALAQARRDGLEARLVLAGRIAPDVDAESRALAGALRLDSVVEFRGAYSQAEAPDIYRGADAYLALTFNDACPNAVIEAMACGLPVVFSDSGGTPELVGAQAGAPVAVAPGWDRVGVPEAADVAAAMLRVAQARDAMGAAARLRACASFDLRAWLARHDAVFRELLARRP
jgi:glycosyltransferase involved in cell wall biosynthesis